MSGWKAKRFWKEATIADDEGGFRVELDGRPVRTPAKTLLVVPTRSMAAAIAAEWDAQEEQIDPESMPVTRSANAALDKVTVQFEEVADMLAAYGGSDLLCYRADHPISLVQRQQESWDPLLDWLNDRFGVRLRLATGVMPVDQDEEGQAVLRRRVGELSPFEMAAFHDLVAISGSLVLALAVIERRLDPDAAWSFSRLDETWQEEQWGKDDEATETSERKKVEFLTAFAIWDSLQSV